MPRVLVVVMSYVEPGVRPAIAQVATGQVTVMGSPPLLGVAVTVNGPREPGAGDTATVAVVGPVACTSIAGAPEPGVVTVSGSDAGVGEPVGPVPFAASLYMVPGNSRLMVQSGVAHVTVIDGPPPTGVAVSL